MLDFFFSSKRLSSVLLDDIDFSLKHTIRKNMKRIILRVENKNEIKVSSAPLSKRKLECFVKEQKEWILERNESLHVPFSKDTSFYYLGKSYSIEHHDSDFIISTESVYLNPDSAKMQSDDFYKIKASEYLPERVLFWQEKMSLQHTALKFRITKRRWGSCNSQGVISFNPYVMKLTYDMIDYIIVHELAHLVHLNHSKPFYRLVEEFIPDYRSVQKEIESLSSRIRN